MTGPNAPSSKNSSSKSPALKLVYFNARGRGEPIRMLLQLAGVPYIDERIEMDRWPTLKEETPFGQLPVLELDNGAVKIAQSVAILRYLGNEYGFVGANNVDNAKLDMVADLIKDAWASEGIAKWPYILLGLVPEPEEGRADYFKQRIRPDLDKYAGILEEFLLEHNTDPLWNGDKITWVHVLAAEFFTRFVEYGEPDCLEAYPHIQQLIARVHSLPQIHKYIAGRAKTLT